MEDIKNKIMELQKEYLTATPSRRSEIEKEIIELAPRAVYPPSGDLQKLEETLTRIKDEVERFKGALEEGDFNLYLEQLKTLSQCVQDYAEQMGVEIPDPVHQEAVQKLLEAKFGKTRED